MLRSCQWRIGRWRYDIDKLKHSTTLLPRRQLIAHYSEHVLANSNRYSVFPSTISSLDTPILKNSLQIPPIVCGGCTGYHPINGTLTSTLVLSVPRCLLSFISFPCKRRHLPDYLLEPFATQVLLYHLEMETPTSALPFEEKKKTLALEGTELTKRP